MSRLFIPNFDFEASLGPHVPNRSQDVMRRNSELAMAWLAIARPGDAILVDELPDPSFDHSLKALARTGVQFCDAQSWASGGRQPPVQTIEPVPWGWDRRVRDWAASSGFKIDIPRLEVITRANSREFSDHCEHEFDCGLAGQAICRSLPEVQAATQSLTRWIIKGNLGAAGRERLAGSGPLNDQSAAWVSRRLGRDGVILIEPFLDAIEEAGIQWEIPRVPDSPKLLGVVPLLSDERGQYHGSIVTPDNQIPDHWQPAVEVTRLAADRIQALGYFGPLGIDAMRYRDAAGEIRLRPLQDINVRWTMGRLALGWRDQIPPGHRGILRCESPQHVTAAATTIRISPKTLAVQSPSKVFTLTIEPEIGPAPRN